MNARDDAAGGEGRVSRKQFGSVQRIVLVGANWQFARHLALQFPRDAAATHFLRRLKASGLCPTSACACAPRMQVSLGFSRRGLENVDVPPHVMACFALKSPAFFAGAHVRAGRYLSASDESSARRWEEVFDFTSLDAVFSLHGCDSAILDKTIRDVQALAQACRIKTRAFVSPERMDKAPEGETQVPDASWVHFGYRDGLSRTAILGWTPEDRLHQYKRRSRHAAGEFLLGHPQDSGANPWIAGPGVRVWPEEVRSFFFNGSFGVLHQIEQHVAAFDEFVNKSAETIGTTAREVKAKLCGRYPDGRPLGMPTAGPRDDFDYSQDRHGHGCPFGSHVRRLNPREDDSLAEAFRSRVLLRRGMPYGQAWSAKEPKERKEPKEPKDEVRRGLMAQFFCASIEDQFEQLVGQWADRVPMGSPDRGTARDPLIGAHQPTDGAFEIPQCNRNRPIRLNGMKPFVSTVGVAYLFYPSLPTLEGIARSAFWHREEDDVRCRCGE